MERFSTSSSTFRPMTTPYLRSCLILSGVSAATCMSIRLRFLSGGTALRPDPALLPPFMEFQIKYRASP